MNFLFFALVELKKYLTKLANKSIKNYSTLAKFSLNNVEEVPTGNVGRLFRIDYPALCADCQPRRAFAGTCLSVIDSTQYIIKHYWPMSPLYPKQQKNFLVTMDYTETQDVLQLQVKI